MTVFIRVLQPPADQKPEVLLRTIASYREVGKEREASQQAVFDRDPASFAAVPGSPFAYWTSNALRLLFRRHPTFEGDERTATRGASTCDDFRYVRLWTEIPEKRNAPLQWRPFTKGGRFSRYYAPIPTVVDWNPVRETFNGFVGRPGRWLERPEAVNEYFKPALTWPLRGIVFSAAAVPRGCIFSVGGKVALAQEAHLPWLLALFNSQPFDALLRLRAGKVGGVQYEVGLIQQTPVPSISKSDSVAFSQLAIRAWSLKRTLDTTNESSHAFLLPLGLNESVAGTYLDAIERELESLQAKIDEAAFTLYGIRPEDAAAIEASSIGTASTDGFEADVADDDVDGVNEDEGPIAAPTDAFTSWLVGVAFGRFDPRLATGERTIPPQPGPFEPLPSRSPGMYPEGEEPVHRPGILVDDEGHADDLAARAREVAERVRVDAPLNLSGWLAKEFFPLHIRMYSKSRRKAPIYWQLATPSASYSVWLYIHAFSKDTLFRVQNDYVAPKLAHEERRLESLTSELCDSATAAQRKILAAQEAVVDELRAFLDEVKRVAPLWKPNLDDGVIINFAPLWRLVPQNKSWQKELKSTWDALCEGKYDWAHIAMHLWPERVVPKCAKDRSLAIAHGLEDVFWVEGTNGKWTARKGPTKSIVELVKERTSPAVSSGLKSLVEAPVVKGGAKKTRKGEANA